MSKSIVAILSVTLLICGCGTLKNVSLDQDELSTAAGNALTALTITDAQINEVCAQTVHQLDSTSNVDTKDYQARIKRIMAGITEVDGIHFNYKVYVSKEINAFAFGDGSIRVYSGLMDVMTDDELFAIIGHEIGHVVHQDSKNAMKNAYLTAAARNVASSVNGTIGTLAKSELGDIAEAFVSARFSQKQEYAADEYGFNFAVSHNLDPYSMYNSLQRLLEISGETSTSSLIQNLFSSHPATDQRAVKVKEMADALKK